MPKAFSDDLRIRISAADESGEGSCRELAKRFGVGYEFVRKLRRQRKENDSALRCPQSRHGPISQLNEETKAYILAQYEAQPDLTIAELQDKLASERGVPVGWSTARRWILKLGLRLKKSRSTLASGTRRPIGISVPSTSNVFARHRQRS